ncbi:MAG: hypothetical protein ACI8PB_004166 [Desulforhopalus sp.]|jgi:hypothetical protein
MEYSIDTVQRTIHAWFTGSVSPDLLISDILTLRSDTCFQDGFNVIVDFREAQVPQGYMELTQVAKFVKATSVVKDGFRIAILVKNVEQTRSAKLYKMLVGHKHVQVCQSIKKAEEWVVQSSDREVTQRVEGNEL